MSRANEMFGAELELIENDTIRGFTELCINKLPAYFWLVPSSSTGKYHCAQSNGTGGLYRHTRAVVYFSQIFCRAYNLEGKDKDIVISACLLHDGLKYGMVMQKFTTKTHDKEMADYVLELGKSYPAIAYQDLMSICTGIAFHFGRWTAHPKAKRFPEDYSKIETVVHLADMASAGKEVNLEFLQENLIG